MPKTRSGRRIGEERDLDQEKKQRNHDREQGFLDFLYKGLKIAFIVIPALFLFWFTVLLVHYWNIKDWESYKGLGADGLKVIIPYIIGVITKFGILDKNHQ